MTTKHDSQTFGALSVIESDYGPKVTMDRLTAELRLRGMLVFARIDHAALAAAAGQVLRPTDLLIFGNPASGTPLMQANQTIGIDLPLKFLVWQDESGKTWLGYNAPEEMASRHMMGPETRETISTMSQTLAILAVNATKCPGDKWAITSTHIETPDPNSPGEGVLDL